MAEFPRPRTGAHTATSAAPIRVALIEDNRLVREGITALLGRYPDLRVVAAEHSARAPLRGTDAQVILLDLGLENGDSLAVAREVRNRHANARIIVMDLLPADEEIVEFIAVGVSGFIMKDANLDQVVETIRTVAAGGEVLPAQMTARLFSEIAKEAVQNGSPDEDSVRLTPREREVIDLIADGMSNKAIGKELGISIHTVKSHLRNIMEKLTLHSRLQIAVYAHSQDDAI